MRPQSTETAKHLYNCNWEGESANFTSSIAKYQARKKNSSNMKPLPSQALKEHEKLRTLNAIKYSPTNKEFRQNLAIMIMCSQRPVKITALKFSTLSLQSFTAILSTSMSYFTLLQTVYDENNDV